MSSKKIRITIIIAVILVILIGGIWYGYFLYKHHNKKDNKPIEPKIISKTCESLEHGLKLEYIFEIKKDEIEKITFKESYIYENLDELNKWVEAYEKKPEYTIDQEKLTIYKEQVIDTFEEKDLRTYDGYKYIYEQHGFTCE